jgi:hypothetical protein
MKYGLGRVQPHDAVLMTQDDLYELCLRNSHKLSVGAEMQKSFVKKGSRLKAIS